MKKILTLLLFISPLLLVNCQGNSKNGSSEENQSSKETSDSKTTNQTQEKAQKSTTNSANSEGKNIPSSTKSGVKAAETSAQTSSHAHSFKQEAGNDSLNFVLHGYVEGGAGSEVILDKLGIGPDVEPLASAVVDKNGEFRFAGKIARPGFYQLRFPTAGIHFILTGGVLHFKSDIDNLSKYKFEGDGAQDSRYIKELYDIFQKYNKVGDSLRQVIERTNNTQKKLKLYDKLDKLNKKKQKDKFQEMKKLIDKAYQNNSIAAPVIAVRADLYRDMDYFKKLLEHYQKEYPENYFVKKLEEKYNNTQEYLEKQKN